MLLLNNVSIAYGSNVLIRTIDAQWYAKQVVGIIGNNGCGKSSLLRAIIDPERLSEGDIQLKVGFKLAHLAQEVNVEKGVTAYEYVLAADKGLSDIYARLAQSEAVNDYATMMQCHTDLAECDGYRVESIIAKILVGLGFEQSQFELPVDDFSGGWRMRLNLARCLFMPSDVLLLDEPTNHLDFESILWLQQWVRSYQGLVLIVSHDRDFLDSVSTHMAHVEQACLTTYKGGYSQFEQERAQAIAQQNAQHQKQQEQIKHLMSFVDRFRAKASKAKQAQGRLKAIERMELVSAFHEQSPFRFEFQPPAQMPDPMMTLNRVSLGYDDHVVLKSISLGIRAGDRIGLLGLNGAGKSTLIKCLAGKLKPLAGKCSQFSGVTVGYFDQHQVNYLPLQSTALEYMQDIAGRAGVRELTQFLAGFAFDRDQSLQTIATFSGGEKARLALAAIVWQRPGLLLLDEPTNHLDLQMREALMQALQNYEGSVVLVTHDRYLLRTLVDELWLVEEGQVRPFDGGVEDYSPVS